MFEKHISPPTNTPTSTARGVSWRSPKPDSDVVSIAAIAAIARTVRPSPAELLLLLVAASPV
jgi:hypothetical protein